MRLRVLLKQGRGVLRKHTHEKTAVHKRAFIHSFTHSAERHQAPRTSHPPLKHCRCKPTHRTHSSLTPLKSPDKVTEPKPSTPARRWNGAKHRGPLCPPAEPRGVPTTAARGDRPGAERPRHVPPSGFRPRCPTTPHGCPRGHSSFHLSRLSLPFRMQPGSASSPARLPRSPARHGAGPDPGKSSPIPHPRERPVPAEVDQGLAFDAVQTRNAVSGEHGGGDSCPQRLGGQRRLRSPGACTLLQT